MTSHQHEYVITDKLHFLFIFSVLLTHKIRFQLGIQKKPAHTDPSAILNPTHSFSDLLDLQRYSCPQSPKALVCTSGTVTTALPSSDG